MSVPAEDRYTHGTHITVAHAMGTTIGINTMILLGSIGYIVNIDNEAGHKHKRLIGLSYWLSQVSLMVFWLALILAGVIKGDRITLNITTFGEMMQPVLTALRIFSFAGLGVAAGLGTIVIYYIKRLSQNRASLATKSNC